MRGGFGRTYKCELLFAKSPLRKKHYNLVFEKKKKKWFAEVWHIYYAILEIHSHAFRMKRIMIIQIGVSAKLY